MLSRVDETRLALPPAASGDPGAAPSTPRRDRLVAILLMLGAVACFACLDASGKWLNRTGNPFQTASVRYLVSFLLAAAVTNPLRRPGVLRTRSLGLQVARAGFLVAATLSSLFALRSLRLTEATAITYVSPLIVAVIAGPLLGEWLDRRRVLSVLAGFVGVLVITRPGSGAFQPAVLLALVTAGSNALYAVATRHLALRDRSETTLLYTNLVGAAALLPLLPFVWTPPQAVRDWLVMAGLGVFGGVGHWLLILAHKRAPASVLAPFFYAQVVWAAVLGLVVFREVPDRWMVLGAAIVAASGLSLAVRGRQPVPERDVEAAAASSGGTEAATASPPAAAR